MKIITLTEELIEALKSERGGFTGETLNALGLKAYPPKGWTFRLRGQQLTEEQYKKALDGRCIVRGKRGRRIYREPETQLSLPVLCRKCGQNLEYMQTGECEPCLWNLIKDDQVAHAT
jgi:hypothetical protein